MSRRNFTLNCAECGIEIDHRHNPICDRCEPLYRDPPFTDDVDPAARPRTPGQGEGS